MHHKMIILLILLPLRADLLCTLQCETPCTSTQEDCVKGTKITRKKVVQENESVILIIIKVSAFSKKIWLIKTLILPNCQLPNG